MITLAESFSFHLRYDPRCDCLYATWLGLQKPPLMLANYETIFQFVEATGSVKLLNDALLDLDGWQELTAWLVQDCFPRLAHQGIRAVAWVLPRQLEAFHDTQTLLAQLQQPLVHTFDDPEAAYAWLHQKPLPGVRQVEVSYH